MRPVLRQHGPTKRIDLHLKHWRHTGAFKAEIEAAYMPANSEPKVSVRLATGNLLPSELTASISGTAVNIQPAMMLGVFARRRHL